MRKLQDVPNIGGVTTADPDGKIIDEASPIPGTGVTEILYNDPIQLFHKLKRLAGITENNLPDNETNGFQLLTALFAQSLPQWVPTTSNVDFSKTKFVTYNNGIYYHKTNVSTDNPPNVDTTNWYQVLFWNGTEIIFAGDLGNRIDALEQEQTSQGSRIATNESAISDHESRLDDLEQDTGWVSLTVEPNASASNFFCRGRKVGNVIYLNGRFDLIGNDVNDGFASYPQEWGLPSVAIYFSGADSGLEAALEGNVGSNTSILYVRSDVDTSRSYSFNLSFPV